MECAILVALIPASAYIWALHYEMGFCRYFNIPFELISLNSTIVLAASRWTLIMISLIFSMYLFVFVSTGEGLLIVIVTIGLFIQLIITSLGYGQVITKYIAYVIPIAVIIIALIIFFYSIATSPPEPSPLRQRISDVRSFIEILAVIVVVWFFASFSFLIGYSQAQNRQEFQIMTHSSDDKKFELVVLRVYGDYLLTAPLTLSTKEIETKLVIFKLSDDSPTSLSLEKVGPLKIKPDVISSPSS
jgi:hypothetical protein